MRWNDDDDIHDDVFAGEVNETDNWTNFYEI